MKTKGKIIIIAVSVTLIGTAILIVVNRKKKQKQIKVINDILDAKIKDPNQSGGQVVIQKSEYDKLPVGQYPIKFGEKNKRVYEIQQLLNKKFGTSIDLDGKYGESTWQGLCDKVWSSWYKIGECYELTKTSPSANNPTGLIKRYITQADFETLNK